MSGDNERIVELLKKDDEHALNEIFHLYFNQLFHFTAGFVKDKEEAKEIVHEAIFRLCQKRNQLRANTSVLGYLIIIVRNLSLNYLRQYRKWSTISLSGFDIENELSLNYHILSNQVWDQLLTGEINQLIETAMGSLTEKCRRVFELSRFENLSNAQIAERLNISVKTVEGHITDALKQLKSHLYRYMQSILFFLG